LPKDYGSIPPEVPRLGPPLPGDLGRPIVAARTQTGPLAVDAEQQRVNQESEAARTSKVFANTVARPSPAQTTSSETTNGATSTDDAFAQNGQDHNASVDRRTTSPDRLAKPASPFVIQAGTIIPAALITGIRSDLPGQITAQITENIYDTPTGRARLVPQGARLMGLYDSRVSFGQSRVLLVWTRLIMPNGRSIVLERHPGADTAGYSGLEDEVDNHWKELLGAAALSTLLGVGSELGSGADTLQHGRSSGAPYRGCKFSQSNGTAGCSAESQYPADADGSSGVSSQGDCQPGPCTGALQGMRTMAKLKLGAIADDKPVKVTHELPASVHRDLVAYAEALARQSGQSIGDPIKLIAPMLARFMTTDRAFAKVRRARQLPKQGEG
jgi:type IV secretory pathway VirB10-like protein